MPKLIDRWRGGDAEERGLSLQWYADLFKFGNNWYGGLNQTYNSGPKQEAPATYGGFVDAIYKSNPVIFACMQRRASVFRQARFKYRQIRQGNPGDLFGTQDLGILERPWPNGNTSDLLARAIQDVDLTGNAYFYRANNRVYRLRPEWVTIILGSDSDPDSPYDAWDVDVLGYLYKPPDGEEKPFLVDEVAHWAPIPDPQANFRGMSWLTPVIREVMADKAMTEHQIKYFENGATPNLVVSMKNEMTPDSFKRWITAFRGDHEGAQNAYRTMYLAGGADATVVGSRLEDFKTVKGHGETRICMAAGVPPVIAGASEGLEGSSLNAGNFAAARRLFADGTMRDLWADASQSFAKLVAPQAGAELWYDHSDVAFLAEDEKDKAEILGKDADIMHTLIAAGYEPDAVTDAVTAGDLSRLAGKHTQLFSVQLQPAGSLSLGKGSPVQGVPQGANGTASPQSGSQPAQKANSAPVLELLARAGGDYALPAPPAPDEAQRFLEMLERDRAAHIDLIRTIAARYPDVNVEIQAPPPAEVRVEPAQVNVTAEPAQVHVSLPELPAPEVNVTVPERSVTVEAPEVTVNVPEQAAPSVDVHVDAPQVDVHVPEQATPEVTVNVPEQAAPDVNVNVELPRADPRGFKILRDEETGQVKGIEGPDSLKVRRDADGRIEGVE